MTSGRPHLFPLVALLGALGLACRSSERAPADTPVARATVDSAIPMDEQLRRFRAKLDPPPDTLRHATASREALVRRFVDDLARRDTVDLGLLLLSATEFAYLYFPEHPYSRPPYEMPPGLMWTHLRTATDRGWRALDAWYAGHHLRYLDHSCSDSIRAYGKVREAGPCTVRMIVDARDTVVASLFGGIVERDGRFKFVTYANKL